MANIDALKSAFGSVLGVADGEISEDLQYGERGWTSVAHMGIVAAIENAFDIMLDTQDVIGMSSFAKAREIVSKYGVDLSS